MAASSTVLCLFLTACVALSHGFLLSDSSVSSTNQTGLWKFTYFDLRARGEITRLLFVAGGKPFIDDRVQFTDWLRVKPTFPYRTLPVLTVAGQVYTQSLAIQAFVARETGLYPAVSRDALMVDQVANAREDLFKLEDEWYIATVYNDTQQHQASLYSKLQAAYPIYLGNWAGYLRGNTRGSGWLVGDSMTLGDIILYDGTQTVFQNQPDLLNQYPELTALRAKVAAQDRIKQYLAKRGNYPL